MKNKGAIGILGGMGPEASSYMYKMLIDLSIKHFDAENNDDFPEIILYSIPVPDFISNSKDKDIALRMLRGRVKDLNKLNIDSLSIACNTAHVLLEELQKESKVPFISMVDEVVREISLDNVKQVGILGSPSTLKSKLYQRKLNKFGIIAIVPKGKQIEMLEKAIRSVIKGNSTDNDYKILIEIADNLKERGAEAILLGCTELPIIFPLQYKIPVYNSVEILCMALLRRYYESNTIDTI